VAKNFAELNPTTWRLSQHSLLAIFVNVSLQEIIKSFQVWKRLVTVPANEQLIRYLAFSVVGIPKGDTFL
jgi:hypothetical protein